MTNATSIISKTCPNVCIEVGHLLFDLEESNFSTIAIFPDRAASNKSFSLPIIPYGMISMSFPRTVIKILLNFNERNRTTSLSINKVTNIY